MAPLLPYIEKYISSHNYLRTDDGLETGGIRILCAQSGVPEKRLHEIREAGKKTIAFDLADRLVCAIADGGLWRRDPALLEVYLAVDISRANPTTRDKKTCARPGCHEPIIRKPGAPRKGPKAKKYCSKRCMQAESRYRTGVRQRRATSNREFPFVCKYGHVRTPENTRIRPNGTRLCRDCARARQAVYRAKRKEAANGAG